MAIFAIQNSYSDDETTRDTYRPEHRAYLSSLAEQGVVLASGPFAPGQAPGALVIVRAESEDAARRLVEDDPFRVNGVIEDYSVTEWEPIIGQWANTL